MPMTCNNTELRCLMFNEQRFMNGISQEPLIRITRDLVCKQLPAWPQDKTCWLQFSDLKRMLIWKGSICSHKNTFLVMFIIMIN